MVFTSKGEAENLTSEPTTANTYSTSKDTSTRDSTSTAEATIVTSEDASSNEYVTSEIIISSKTTVNTECQHPRGNYCYELFYDDKVLFDAHNHCRNLGTGSNLVSILDIEEALFLRDLITSSSLEPLSDYWIGLNSNRYRWGDGKSLFYANFHTKFVPGDCASMDSPEMKWTAVDCTKNKNFLCEGSLSTIGKLEACTLKKLGSQIHIDRQTTVPYQPNPPPSRPTLTRPSILCPHHECKYSS
ncbi:putative regenerating islet-derived protein 4 [Apostichopus japonicus]|uniref:Putative regenerating islet-derived protein 4 n=1 Tax=Stichopus japonicus TaxID=307972 RepID=A0A2G8KYA9_STIJA|nr:putative regenerating islet-derived protein 4 [Apostichopus japonicus]